MWVRLKAKCQNFTIIQCYAPTNDADEEDTDNFYERLQLTLNNTPKRDIKIVMGDLNAKIGNNNKNRERIMGKHGIGEMNENGLKLVEFCEANELVIGGSLFPHKNIHKTTWESPDGKTKNQIDHIMINQRWRSSLQDVRVMRGADCKSYDTGKDLFQLELKNKFSALYNEELELDIESEWTAGKNIIKSACETVLGNKTIKKKEWMSDLSWQKVEERREMKGKINSAKTRAQKYSTQVKHQELHKEVKKSFTLEPGPDLNIKVDNIKKPEIKKALKSLKTGKQLE
uniref:Craniofacial development protein 2-like n=1 Tax=Crassostrea virginica TaxID=6565 RepID=A0A8B8D463_CRAVI|nr:craniofacial development protein 2-like [Crassostrea virginica]